MRRLWYDSGSMHPVWEFVGFCTFRLWVILPQQRIHRDAFLCRFLFLFGLRVFFAWAGGAHEVSRMLTWFPWLFKFALSLFVLLGHVPLLVNFLVSFDNLINHDVSWSFIFRVQLLVTLFLMLLWVEFFVHFYEVAFHFLKLVHHRKILLESWDLCVRSTQTQLLPLNSNHAIEKGVEDVRHLQMLLSCGLQRTLALLLELNEVVIRIWLDIFLNLSFECF